MAFSSRMRSVCCLLLLALTGTTARAGTDTLKVLFIGNSFTAVNNLPDMIRQIAASAGDSLEYNMQAPGGYTLEMHSTNTATLAALATPKWDYVVLQEQSQRPAFPESQVVTDFYPWAVKMDSLVHAANPCAKVVLYNTWGYRNGDPDNCPFFTPLCTFHGMDSMLHLRYAFMADSLNAKLCPVGPLFHRIRDASATMDLYSSDDRHPSLLGTFAAANTFYATLFGKSPMNTSYNPTGIVAPEAQAIRSWAAIHVFDSLAYWNQYYEPQPLPTAAFSVDYAGQTVTFTNTSLDAMTYSWDFDDGETSTEASPVHTYATPGIYDVMLTAVSCAGKTDTVRHVNLTGTAVPTAGSLAALRLAPNPATGLLVISGALPGVAEVVVTNTFGQVVLRAPLTGGRAELHVQALPAGIYQARAGAAATAFQKQ